MKKYLVLLTTAILLLALTACDGNCATTTPPTEQEIFTEQVVENDEVVDNATSETQADVEEAMPQEQDWLNLGAISIPPDWTFIGDDNVGPFSMNISGRGMDGILIPMQVWDIPFADPYMFIDEFSSRQQFIFNDGRVGYMLKEPFSAESTTIAAWTDTWMVLSLHYIFSKDAEVETIFNANEELILSIARTLTNMNFPNESEANAQPHPFATALREYMENYDGVVRADLVTLDDDGAIGMLISRMPTLEFSEYWEDYVNKYHETLFFMQNGNLFQLNTSGLFVSGRYNRLVGRFHTHTFMVENIYKLEFGRLEVSTSLEYFSDEYLSMLFDNYNVVAELISERDALSEAAIEKYGLVAQSPPNLGHMQNTQDQTAQILAMTVNGVPR